MVNVKRTSLIKRILKSKTMLAATAIEVLGVVQLNSDFLSTVMSPSSFGWVMLGIGIAMKVLRMVTTTSIGEK